jgi:flagellar biosynthesis anti-sigma factor FlgM
MKLSWSIQTFGTAFLGHTAHGSGSMICTSSCEEEDFTAKSEADKDKFSQRERVIRRALEIVQEAPDLREDRVQAARRALADGTLPLDGATLAEKLLQHARRG